MLSAGRTQNKELVSEIRDESTFALNISHFSTQTPDMALCGHPVKTVLKLATPQSAVSQQQPMSQKSGLKSQRQACGDTAGCTVVAAGASVAAVGASDAESAVFTVEFTARTAGTSTPVEFTASVPLGAGVAELNGSPSGGVALTEDVPTDSVAP